MSVEVGAVFTLTFDFLDQNGQPMAYPDHTMPEWSNENPAVETIAPADDGRSCTVEAVAAGSDLVQVKLDSDGKQYASAMTVTVNATPEPSVVTQIAIRPE
jgi:hypothetical protein